MQRGTASGLLACLRSRAKQTGREQDGEQRLGEPGLDGSWRLRTGLREPQTLKAEEASATGGPAFEASRTTEREPGGDPLREAAGENDSMAKGMARGLNAWVERSGRNYVDDG